MLLIELYIIFAKNGKPELVQGNDKNKVNNMSCRMLLQHNAGEKQQQVEDFTFGADTIISWQWDATMNIFASACHDTNDIYQARSYIAPYTVFQLTWFFRKLSNMQVWNILHNRNDLRQRGVIWVTYRCYNSNP